jgi:hypothetical protein
MLLGLGDSVTAGFGARRGYSYFDLLVKNSPDDSVEMRGLCLSTVIPNLQVKNRAVSGSTSLQHLEYQVSRLPVCGTNTLGLVVMTTERYYP